MSIAEKRWAQLAQETQFHQLDSLRRQAEGWRTGLAGLTALLGAVLIVKGRSDISNLAPGVRYLVVVLLAGAFVLLVTASLLALRAASGWPDDEIYLTGESLRAWHAEESERIRTGIRRAARLMVVGLVVLAAAVGLTWLGPGESRAPLVSVETSAGPVCGELVGVRDGHLIVGPAKEATGDQPEQRVPRLVPLPQVTRMTVVKTC
ncbi:hypothetical protein [Micromonospora echinofusca]|uniref:Uncharacterized protein n=1 Tax=Micromonospora echinofusca TaxID=47858 RepID=A0ABS3VWP0_MICEH|nr:hypothetical protein [Micromonospora echinofusca]MBO4208843.1 hypothetical protein [Micromonospora echinofusca]